MMSTRELSGEPGQAPFALQWVGVSPPYPKPLAPQPKFGLPTYARMPEWGRAEVAASSDYQ